MLPSTLDMVPSPSTWNPRPSTLDKKIDSNFPSLYSPFLKKLAVKTKCKSIKVMDQGDWKKGLVVPGSFLTRTTSRAISTKFEKEIIPLKTLKTLENLKQATGQI